MKSFTVLTTLWNTRSFWWLRTRIFWDLGLSVWQTRIILHLYGRFIEASIEWMALTGLGGRVWWELRQNGRVWWELRQRKLAEEHGAVFRRSVLLSYPSLFCALLYPSNSYLTAVSSFILVDTCIHLFSSASQHDFEFFSSYWWLIYPLQGVVLDCELCLFVCLFVCILVYIYVYLFVHIDNWLILCRELCLAVSFWRKSSPTLT